MNTTVISIEEYDKIYQPYSDKDGYSEMFFNWTEVYEKVQELFPNEPLPYRHIWSATDTGERYYILQNGYHPCNNLHFEICTVPWGTEDDKENASIHIEADNNDYEKG